MKFRVAEPFQPVHRYRSPESLRLYGPWRGNPPRSRFLTIRSPNDMKHSLFLLLVLSSIECVALDAAGAGRPRYGGTLRVELQTPIVSLEASSSTGFPDTAGVLKLRDMVYDRLIKLD